MWVFLRKMVMSSRDSTVCMAPECDRFLNLQTSGYKFQQIRQWSPNPNSYPRLTHWFLGEIDTTLQYIFKMMLSTENVSTLCLVTLRFLRKGPIGHVTLVVITSTTILVPYLKVKPLQLIWRSGTGWFLLQAPNLKMRCRDFIIWQGARILTHCGLAMP